MNAPADSLPDGPLLTWYGDDFTGATAVMEVLSFAGLPAVLFLGVPNAEQLAAFADYRAIGIAGSARSQSPDWMEAHLPACFSALASIGAPIAHYKVCSTFDSSPEVGSIGRAAELAVPLLGGDWHPLVVAAPEIARYQAFGNLFASVDGVTYRLDRHPVMSRHPVTPMDESDVRLHLGRQTGMQIGLVDYLRLMAGEGDRALSEERDRRAVIIAIDVVDEATLAEAGRLVWENRGDRLFAVGSQGLEYALVAFWRKKGLISERAEVDKARPVERIAAVSGSCSPVTAGQIAWAGENGFNLIEMDAACAVRDEEWTREQARVAAAALAALGQGIDPIIYTAMGPEDPAIGRLRSAVDATGQAMGDVCAEIGRGLGAVLSRVLHEAGVTRGVIAGGDTSSFAASGLGLYALTATGPIAPGAPLCRGHSDDPEIDGFEIELKGGQMGQPDFFGSVRKGGKMKRQGARP